MKRIRFKKIKLLSYRERKAKTFDLDSNIVVIKGPNHIGKSCILKSIYNGIGGTVKKVARQWSDANVIVILYFSVDGNSFKSLKMGNQLYIYNLDGSLRQFGYYNSLKIRKQLNELFGLYISSEANQQILSANSIYMPFYIDQDSGWYNPWSSFTSITSSEKSNARLYLSGIVDGLYLSKKTELSNIENQIRKNYEEQRAYNKLYYELKKENIDYIPITKESFKSEINSYLSNLKSLRESQKEIVRTLQALYTKKTYYEVNIQQLHKNMKEMHKDFGFALKQGDIVTCPTCGAQYKNDMIHRHEILKDESTCKNLIIDYQKELDSLNSKIEAYQQSNTILSDKITEVQRNLKASNEDVSLGQVIDSEANQKLLENLIIKIEKIDNFINDLSAKKISLEGAIKQYDKGRREESVKDFKSYVISYLSEMGIRNVDEASIKFGGKVNMTGSNVPIYQIAYTFAYYKVMHKYSGPVFFPIVIDEPRQQGLRDNGLQNMISFITSHTPENGQLILSIAEENMKLPENTKIIELSPNEKILCKEEYSSISEEIDNLLNKSFFKQ